MNKGKKMTTQYTENQSLKALLVRYVECNEDTDKDYTSYIVRFIDAEKKVKESLDRIYSNKKSKRLRYDDILSRTPEQILKLSDGKAELSKLIHAYIRTLPFTERLDAIFQFNELFANGVEGYEFSRLSTNEEKGKKKNKRNSYCAIERLLDQTEIEILLLKRLQIDEFSHLSRAGLVEASSGRRQNRDSRDRISAEFMMSPQSLQPHLNRLEQGTNILGHEVKIDLGDTGVVYDNSVHPVFLTLNPSEAALLTVNLKQRYANSDLPVLAENIANDIYSQLSEQVREKIDIQAKRVGVEFPANAPHSVELRRYRQERGSSDGYDPEIVHKRAARFSIVLKDDPTTCLTGILISRMDWEYELQDDHGMSLLKHEDGSTRLIHRDEIIWYQFIEFP